MKIYIDNIPVLYPGDNLLKPTFTLRKQDESGSQAFSFTGDITFYGTDFDYVYQKLVTDTNAKNNKIELKFVHECCEDLDPFLFEINSESVKWCENECSITAAAIEKSLTNDQLTCLKNTLIYDNYAGFQNKQHPRMIYCNELRPNWLGDLVMIFIILFCFTILSLSPILIVIGIIVTIINKIIDIINNLPNVNVNKIDFDNNPETGIFQEMKNFKDQMLSFAIGCGRKHPSPLVRDYADNVCGKCGLTFQSDIFKNGASPYFNTVFVNAPIAKGTQITDTTTYWIDQNKPILNGVMFFDKLKSIHNAKWLIFGNVLRFERRDAFLPGSPWLDLTTYPSNKISVCYSWSKKTLYSYANFQYQKDAINWVGSEAIARWSDIVEWNNPYSPNQKGAFEPLLEFAACRFRDDGIDRDVLTAYENAPFIGNIIKQSKRAMLLNSHQCFTPMLLIWDGNTPESAKVDNTSAYFQNFPSEGDDKYQANVGVNQFYNYPYWFNANFPGNLYDKFWSIDNPKLSTFQGFDFTAEITFDCALLAAIDLDGTVKTSKGLAEVNEITLNFALNKMILKGTV